MFVLSESQIMRWRCLFIVAIVLFLLAGSEAFATKPRPPLALSLTNRDLPDGQIELTLEATAFVTAEKVELVIDLPPSVALVSGEVRWDGTIAVGEKKAIKVFIRTVSTIPARVIGAASVYFPQGGSVKQQETVLLNPPQEKALPIPGPLKKPRQEHDTIFEFKGK
ncbi:MAG: hypothetical protein HY037_03335 [Nitrospirae bacterium]|nr:hypothetical protein [Candidatus Troglogloeales bacterium]